MKEYLQIIAILLVIGGPPLLIYLVVNSRKQDIKELDDAEFEKFWLLKRFIDQAPAGSVSQRRLDWLEDREKTRVFRELNTIIWEVTSRVFVLVLRAKWDRSGQVVVEGRIRPPTLAALAFPCWMAILSSAYSYWTGEVTPAMALKIGAFILIFLLGLFGVLLLVMLPIERIKIRKEYYPTMKNFLWPGRKK